jgi:hypothetical protein
MYIKIVSRYPQHLAVEVSKLYLEAMKKVPDDRSISKPAVRAAVEAADGKFLITAFYTAKPGKLREALDLANERMLIFTKIQGFEYSINVAYEVGEAMKFIGMEAPE